MIKLYMSREKYNKYKLVVGRGLLLLGISGTIAVGLSAYSKNMSDNNNNNNVDMNTEQDVVTTTESQVQPTTESQVQPTTENNAEIDSLQNDITNLMNEEILSNGVINITEESKKDEVELITNAYITINASDISAKSIGSLDQDGEFLSSEMTEDYLCFVESLSNSIAISDKETVINSTSLFAKDDQGNILNQNDYEFLQNYLNTVADYNQAIKDGDKVLSDEKFAQLNSIKDIILTDKNITTDINSSTLYMVVDSMLHVPNLVKSEETKAQLINYLEETCENKITTNEEVDNTVNNDASQGSYGSSFSSLTDKLKAILDKASEFRNGSDSKYSYSNVISIIMSKIDLSKYKAPVTTFVEQESDKQQKTSDSESNSTVVKNKETKVESESNQTNQNVEGTTEYVYLEDDVIEELTDAERKEANDAGIAQAKSDYQNGVRNSNPLVGGKTSDWNYIYSAAYNIEYNDRLQEEQEQEQELEQQQAEQPVELSYNNSELQILNDLKSMFSNIGLTFEESYYAQVQEDSVKTM